ncbi:MAG: hypothetical protein JNM24_12445 [Bdellovibrionaceae bacterium]|jgi:hypothetical protein|nr:hypothetical protein [Pseudobdellovibrionaceae bacterium]
MKLLLATLTLVFSILAHADLATNAFAKIQYQEIAILEIHSVASKIKFVPASATNIAYYDGYVIVSATVEGNLCTTSPSSFGTLRTLEGRTVFTKLISGSAWSTQLTGCPQYSRPTRVAFPVSVGWLVANGNAVNQTIASFKVGNVSLKPVNLIVNARGSQIQVLVKK